jgi:flagellar basal-body rod modification protein FlgD
MEISSSPQAFGAAAQPAAKPSINLSSDFETFIRMLTTQAENQDPLEPIDSTEYAAQLAQFSMVEQQVKSNDLLTALGAQLGAGNIAQFAGWIGMEARNSGPAYFDGNPISVSSKPAPNADEAFLVVRDSRGAEVQRSALPLAAQDVVWAGVTSDGAPFPTGQYRFAIESRLQGEVVTTSAAQTYARITEARLERGETVLIVKGGGTLSADAVTGLREAVSALSV